MADHSRRFRTPTRPVTDENIFIPPIRPAESNDSSCNLSWIDVDTTTSENHDDNIESHSIFENKDDIVRGDIPIIVDERHFGDSAHPSSCAVKNTQQEISDVPKEEAPYVEIIDTHYETIEGYDWDGILDLQNRIKKQKEQQRQGITALEWVTEFRLYLTDGLLEEATEEASLALDDGPRYEVVEDKEIENEGNYRLYNSSDGAGMKTSFKIDDDDFVEFVESSREAPVINTEPTMNASSQHDSTENDEEYASLALSPLDVLTNSLMGTKAFHRNHHHHSVRLTELIVGGPSLKLGELSIERLARALVCGGSGALRKLVLIVSAVDLSAMNALGECFRATSDSLEDLHFYASQTTERLVASRSRYKNVPSSCVLGPGISYWVDAWTHNPNNRLRSLNLSRMDIGDEAAFALSRLVLSAPRLKVLNLAQDDFYASSRPSYSQEQGMNESNHPPLSFAGTKRLLESLILIEDIKRRSLTSSSSQPTSCANLLELDLSGWILEDEESKTDFEQYDDDEMAIDNFYDDYNYIDDGAVEDEFEFANANSDETNLKRKPNTRKNKRACCVIASMLRVNTTLQKLVLVAEDGSADTKSSGLSERAHINRGLLSVRSTLAIARALRDHVSVSTKGRNSSGQRPLGSNLRTLVLSTNYTRGATRSKAEDASSWAITERKRAVAKVFYQALTKRPLHQLRLQELSCTAAFKGLESIDAGTIIGTNAQKDLKDQLEFYLQKNRSKNLSLKSIDSFWRPRISSIGTATIPQQSSGDDEDEDCHFVEIVDIDSDPTMISNRESKKNSPPLLVFILPALLAKAGKEASHNDVVFSCAKILAQKTKLWEISSEYRCDL